MFKASIAVSTLIIFGSNAFAQGAFQCDNIITKGLREYNISSQSSSYLNNVFSQYCYESGESKTSASSTGLDTIIKAIPIKFTHGSADARSAMQNFCKTYKSSTEAKETSNNYQETIVRKAYDTYIDCVNASQLGYYITHDVITPAKLHVFLRAGVGRPIKINAVDTSPNITCVGNANGKQIKYSTSIGASSDVAINMFCTRTSRKADADTNTYDEGSVAIDISGAKYNFFIPKSDFLPENLASQIGTSILELRNTLSTHENENSLSRSRLLSLLKNANDPGTDGATAPNRVNGPSEASCPAGQYLVGLKLNWRGTCQRQCDGDGGILGGLTVVCRPL